MNNIIKSILLVGLLIFSACESLEEINIDPTRPTDVELSLILPGTITQTIFNQGAEPPRVAGIIMQQFEGFDAQQVAYTDYVLPDVTFNNYWRTGLYAGSLRSAQLMIDKAAVENAPHYAGIAKILLAIGYADATSYFGDIPFSDALQGLDNLKPSYDTQEQIYSNVQSLLDEAMSDLSQDGGLITPGSDDLIYRGDTAAWIATAQALKARYLMQTIKRNPSAATTILDIIRNSAFQSTDAQPELTWGTAQTDNNPLAKFGTERPNTLIIDSRFAAKMEAANDPRQSAYMKSSGDDYLYFDDGIDGTLYWAQNNSTIPLISLEELQFIEAELELMAGNDDAAKTALLAAVTTNMAHLGIDGTDYITALDEDYDAASNKHETIISEAYTAYYGQAFHQSWANYRRTGYPSLTPSPTGDNGLNPGGAIPKRYIYPISESETNADNLKAAIDNQGGSALMNVALWAFQ